MPSPTPGAMGANVEHVPCQHLRSVFFRSFALTLVRELPVVSVQQALFLCLSGFDGERQGRARPSIYDSWGI